MTDDRLPLAELLAKAEDGDFLRSVAGLGAADERVLLDELATVTEVYALTAWDLLGA